MYYISSDLYFVATEIGLCCGYDFVLLGVSFSLSKGFAAAELWLCYG